LLTYLLEGKPYAYQDPLFRSACAALFCFAFMIVTLPTCIRWLTMLKMGDVPEFDHDTLNALMQSKANVPTMGGLAIMTGIALSILLLCDLTNFYVQVGLACLVWLCALGCVDDWLKLTAKRRGLRSRDGLLSYEKLLFQVGLGVLIGFYVYNHGRSNYAIRSPLVPATAQADAADQPLPVNPSLSSPSRSAESGNTPEAGNAPEGSIGPEGMASARLVRTEPASEGTPQAAPAETGKSEASDVRPPPPATSDTGSPGGEERVPAFKILSVPFYKPGLTLGATAFMILTVLVTAGTSNAVNLTDGMDGLASGCVAICSLVFIFLTYVVGSQDLAASLLFLHVPHCHELVVFCGAIFGACIGFLWYNCHPARIFMGDTGSLPLGGLIGYVAVVTRQELMLFFAGGIFVIEAVSVMLQVGYFKATGGKRIFRMAPIHHHFHLGGWSETQTVVRFWVLAGMFAVFALATIKLR
ncbi:MAG: phospho-N-acetylmuramoyl-pentapeptide-transferase, partial [Phycisphaerae bacterium]